MSLCAEKPMKYMAQIDQFRYETDCGSESCCYIPREFGFVSHYQKESLFPKLLTEKQTSSEFLCHKGEKYRA